MTSSTVLEFMTNNPTYVRHDGRGAANVTYLFPRSDSGYGSIDGCSTDSPRYPGTSSVSPFDGPRSHHGSDLPATDEKNETPRLLSRPLDPTESLYSTPTPYRSFIAWKPQHINLPPGGNDTAHMARFRQKCSRGGLRTPDRFVPQRDSEESSRQVYQTTKPLQDLSPTEKLLRRNGASVTPFSPPQRPPTHVVDEARMALVGQARNQGLYE